MSILNTYHIYALSERAAVIDFGNIINEQLNRKVLSMQRWLGQNAFKGLKDTVAAYSSLTVLYDPFIVRMHSQASTCFDAVKEKLEEAFALSPEEPTVRSKEISLPVCYDPVFGYDIEQMAAAKNMSMEELVQIHCSVNYRVYMLGFLPGFAYMGTVDERLATSRKHQPAAVAAGSVGIAGSQTGIYPLDSPGGWQIIGRTPVKMFDPQLEEPVFLHAGDTVIIYPISIEEFHEYGARHN